MDKSIHTCAWCPVLHTGFLTANDMALCPNPDCKKIKDGMKNDTINIDSYNRSRTYPTR